MLTVKHLRDLLDGMADDELVIMSGDPEGNRYHYLETGNVSEVIFRPDHAARTGTDGHVVSADEDAEDGDVRAICIWPA